MPGCKDGEIIELNQSFRFEVFIQTLYKTIRKTNFRNIDLIDIRPAHYIDVDLQCRHNNVCAVFTQFVNAYSLFKGKTGKLLVIISQQFELKRLAFFLFADGKNFVDISAGTNGDDR